MRLFAALTAGLLTALTVQGVATAQDESPAVEKPRMEAAAKNVRLRTVLPGTERAISIAFMQYGRKDVAFVSGQFGLKSFDVTDVDHPKLLDHLTNNELALPGDDPAKGFWENEDLNVDPRRRLVFMAREMSTFGQDKPTGVYLLSALDPADLRMMSFQQLHTGHITSCVNNCDYLWTTGFDGSDEKQGRVYVTDIRDPRNPKTLPVKVDLRGKPGQDKVTHDVQVDAQGVAWVAGDGGTRGYWTDGWRRDPLTGEHRRATADNPVPYAGGAVPKLDMPTSFTHNSFRPVGTRLADGPLPTKENPAGSLLLHTEEAFGDPTCKDQGRFVISSLKGTENGEGWGENPKEMKTVGVWSPDDQEGTLPGSDTFCSAHYFDVRKRIVAYSWYEQGTRFLDISNPAKPIQIAYWRPDGAVSFAPYWHGDSLFLADLSRGVEILTLTKDAHAAQESGTNVQLVTTPSKVKAGRSNGERLPLVPDPVYGRGCPMMAGRDGKCGPGSCC
ncbi:hypothetical protein FKR81_39240 [Lentzea tibetensis]|uniref:Uncharacterized protein n=1 Tax=Lentzea tibetensis TaxID=2591470 RepID=A0A563EH15_9PSEU|nr:hypothetical protein [Lentzea tibetensis]TWP45461.1 hypothetical protein FKR81_39240 [Lentzea tibetensis]